MNAPQYGQQPYYAAPEGIAITTKYSGLWTPMYGATRPKVFVDGHERVVGGWGRAVLPVASGQHHVQVYTSYFFPRRAGRADYTAVVGPGQVVELEYKAPLFTFSRGSLGPPPQRYNAVGLITFLVIMVVLMAAMLLMASV